MTKEAKKSFLSWTTEHQATFNGIKALVTSLECLTTIDYDNPGENLIFLTCDASDHRSGTVLSWEKDVKSSWPVAFDSEPFCHAELNYPMHEKELVAIIHSLQKWWIELLSNCVIV